MFDKRHSGCHGMDWRGRNPLGGHHRGPGETLRQFGGDRDGKKWLDLDYVLGVEPMRQVGSCGRGTNVARLAFSSAPRRVSIDVLILL